MTTSILSNIDIGGAINYSSIISPSQITSNQNNYSPTGADNAFQWRLSTDASRNITGISCSQVGGRLVHLFNSGSNNIVLKHNDSNSTSTNRMLLPNAVDITLKSNEGILLYYDGTATSWVALGYQQSHNHSDANSGTSLIPANVSISQTLHLTGVINPSSIGSNQNNYAPTGIATATRLRITSSQAVNITGISASQTEGRIIHIYNYGSFNITLKHYDAGSTASNRFFFLAGTDKVLGTNGVITLMYDAGSELWMQILP